MSINDIVISGMSGRLPESRNVEEFRYNLFNGIDMVTQKEDRWPEGLHGIVNRMGRIPDFNLFDDKYFGVPSQTIGWIDPKSRLLLETTYEAIIDAGINPQTLRGSRTGVYIGVTGYGMSDGLHQLLEPDSLASLTRGSMAQTINMTTLLANRISYLFDFKGPSLVVDTACSASLTALNIAMNDFKLGNIDYAIVGGSHITLQPNIIHFQQEGGICSPQGISAVLDENANGFVKGDGTACLLLQKSSTAKRVYATVLSSRINVDGWKTVGMYFPSSEEQENLMVTSYEEAGIDPLKLTYMEAHSTGTKIGDPQEIKAIYNAYVLKPGRKDVLPLGLLKSNMGHSEGCSGMAAIIKVILCYENESIPPNINLKQIKHEIKQYCPPLYPNTELIKYEPGMAAINNFGIGGVNANVLVEPNYKLANEDNLRIAETIPRIVNICGRTEEAVRHVFDFIENNPEKISRDFLALLTDTMKPVPSINSAGLPFRGSIFIKKISENQTDIKYQYIRQTSEVKNKQKRSIWLLFPGLGGQWVGMAKALMPIKIFADKVEECHQIMSEFGVDLKYLLLSEDKEAMLTMTAKFCATTCIELALFEVLKALDITPDGIIGHSFGEIACAYADGCLTTKGAMAVSYFRGFITENDKQIPKGLMAVCGLNKLEAKKLIPSEVMIACYNGKNTVVLSGPEKQMKEMMTDLKLKNIFVHQLDSSGIPYHSKYMKTSAQPMIDMIKKYLSSPKRRSDKWISTSVLETNREELKYASAEYFVNNLISPVHFYDKLKDLPSDSIIIEIGPHAVFRKIVGNTLDSATYISLLKKDSNETNLDNFLTAIATLYGLGLNPSIENLYPRVEWPVSRSTPSIGSLMKWDHTTQFSCYKYPDHYNINTASDMTVTIELDVGHGYYSGHCIDGNIIFPAAGYLMLAWRIFARTCGKRWKDVPVAFEDVQFVRPIFLHEDNKTTMTVRYDQHTCDFHILENDNVCATGKIRSPTDNTLQLQDILHKTQNSVEEYEFCLETEDIYKELGVKGYDYSGEFQGLKNVRTNDFTNIVGECEWKGLVVPFLDSLFQIALLTLPFRTLMFPIMIRNLRIDPTVLFESLRQNRNTSDIDYEDQIMDSIDTAGIGKRKIATNIIGATVDLMKDKGEEYCLFNADMFFCYNSDSKTHITHGIEIEDIVTIAYPRKSDSVGLTLDSYQFVANHESDAIDDHQRNIINEYIEVCKLMASKTLEIVSKKIDFKIHYQKASTHLLDKYRQHNNENHVLFKMFDKIYQSSFDENKNQKKLTKDELIFWENQLKQIDLNKDLINKISKNEKLIRSMTDIVSESFVPIRELRVTEINLTSDLLAKEVKQNMSHFQLYQTEIDYNLIVKSSDCVVEEYSEKTIIWNTNEEPSIPESHLIIFRVDSHPIQMDIKVIMEIIINRIQDNGFFLFVYKNRFTEPELALKSLINDKNSNEKIDLESRLRDLLIITNTSLKLICNKTDSIGTSALLFRKVKENKKILENEQIIEITGERHEDWFQQLKVKLIFAKDLDNRPDNVWLIAKNSNINGILGLVNCLRLEPGGEILRCIFDYDSHHKQPFDWTSKPFSEILNNDLPINVIKDGKLGTYRHFELGKSSDKVLTDEYFLNMTQAKDLSSLQWFDLKKIKNNKNKFDLNGNKIDQVPVCIYSSGVTFRDIMIATGRIPSGNLLLHTDCLIGLEFAGRRTDTGQRVMGIDISRCFATFINANSNLITPIPDHWSMDDAITVLTTYCTSWYGLIDRAMLKRGESVLIHSGTGGVGQSAINICKHYDCDIYVTVGNEEKKQFLMNEYNIPENRIFSSRDIQFKHKIKELTKGKGVKIVLNSLAEEKLVASFECLANGGRFVEIGKFDMFQNRKLGMFDYLRDISFIGVSVDTCLTDEPDFNKRFFKWMHKNCNNGCVKPLNKIVFNANEAENAFRYMTTGKHIGKIVIKIREEEKIRNPIMEIKPAKELICTGKTFFDSNKAYIITGGLGGFGLELVHWMKYNGARKFILTSRSGLKTNYQKYIIKRLMNFGEQHQIYKVQIRILQNDCLSIESTKRVIEEASGLGQIGGIFHLSNVLNDCLLENMTFDQFCETNDSKYRVFDNLDVISRKLSYHLDYFVVMSSVICGIGNTGQSNYGFGNSLCERICEQRRKDGLHGLAIQYGPIGDVGLLANKDQVLVLSTRRKQRINSVCDVLDKLLSVKQSIVTSFVKSERNQIGENTQNRVITEFWKALGVDPETTPDHLTLGEIGMESMFAVELQQKLEREFNLKLTLNNIKQITVKMLKEYGNGNVEAMNEYLKDFGLLRTFLKRFKFIIPKELYTHINSVKKGKPIYFMPPFEINFSSIEILAKNFDRPVIGLNWTKDMNKLETIQEITKHYKQLLETLEPNGKYDLVGYLDGALVISKLMRKGLINKAVIIDIISDKRVYDDIPSEEIIIQFLFGFLANELTEGVYNYILQEVNSEPDFNSKVHRIVSETKLNIGPALIAPDMEEIFHIAVNRTKIAAKYMREKRKRYSNNIKEIIGKKWSKTTGKLSVLKPFKFDKVDNPDKVIVDTRELYLFPGENVSKEFSIEGLDMKSTFDITTGTIADKIISFLK